MSNKLKRNNKKGKKKVNNNKTQSKVYEIVMENDKRLYDQCIDVDVSDHERLIKIAFKMIRTMDKNKGVGINHTQIDTGSVNLNMFVMQFSNGIVECCINSKILKYSKDKKLSREGCLSVKGEYNVSRSVEVDVEYYSLHLKKIMHKTLKGANAVIFQHEFQHTNGITINMEELHNEKTKQ